MNKCIPCQTCSFNFGYAEIILTHDVKSTGKVELIPDACFLFIHGISTYPVNVAEVGVSKMDQIFESLTAIKDGNSFHG
jgi:hypothetical protein